MKEQSIKQALVSSSTCTDCVHTPPEAHIGKLTCTHTPPDAHTHANLPAHIHIQVIIPLLYINSKVWKRANPSPAQTAFAQIVPQVMDFACFLDCAC